MSDDDLRYFGERWNVPMLADAVEVETPVGEACLHCEEPILLGEQGVMRLFADWGGTRLVPMHRECDLRGAVGGINHLKGDCTCHGGTQAPDPPDVTRREAARLVLDYVLTPEYQATLR